MNGLPLLTLLLFLVIFFLVQMDLVNRGVAMLGGGVIFLLIGGVFGFYRPGQAMEAIYFDTLALLFGMSMISDCLLRAGLFHHLALRVVLFSRGNGMLLLVSLVLITYAASLIFNNLSVMVILVPMTLAICRTLVMDPAPVVSAELIASNLGGASTLVGDLPNMIIGAVGRLHFEDFLAAMMPLCLVLLAVLLVYFTRRMAPDRVARFDPETVRRALTECAPPGGGIDPYLMKVGGWVFLMTLSGFLIAPVLGVRPAAITLLAGILILGWGRLPVGAWFQAMGGAELMFFVGLFVMVGGLRAAGVLDGLYQMVLGIGGGNGSLAILALMWLAFLLTPLFNAGPATALLVPVAKALHGELGDNAVWWALSLGILAGSSATLSGATAGPVVAGMMSRAIPPGGASSFRVLDFHGYLAWGLPAAAIFLCMASFHILLIAG
ncbi:MAG: hypothetical protein HQM03_06875 [Magnetococcales bacterium]|nr:hypothetical protein [Magnetococcales bacterium]